MVTWSQYVRRFVARFVPPPPVVYRNSLFVCASRVAGAVDYERFMGQLPRFFFLLHVRCTSYAGPFYLFLAEALLFVVLVGLQSAFADLRSGLFQTGGPLYRLQTVVSVVDLRQTAFIPPTHCTLCREPHLPR